MTLVVVIVIVSITLRWNDIGFFFLDKLVTDIWLMEGNKFQMGS